MTCLVALATKDALVLGCDSLGTTLRNFINPSDLVEFFDQNSDLKVDSEGSPILKKWKDISKKLKLIPYTHMTHITKLFSLSPLEMGIMSTGIASIGKRTIRSLIEEFKNKELAFKNADRRKNYTVKSTATKILKFIKNYYIKEYGTKEVNPSLEIILGGYDKRKRIPTILRIELPEMEVKDTLKDFGIVFGGQMKEIQRIVFGTDASNLLKIRMRHFEQLWRYREKINKYLADNNIQIEIPIISIENLGELDMISNNWSLDGFDANWGDFSEQNAIECVDFFVNIMIKSQQFCFGMPTVGGEVHIALINKKDGFRFISKEEYSHFGHFVPKELS